MLDRLLCWIGAHEWDQFVRDADGRPHRFCRRCDKTQKRGYDFMEPIWVNVPAPVRSNKETQ